MPSKTRLVLDTMSEVYDLLKPWANEEFWNFDSVNLIAGSIYVIGRQHLLENKDRIIQAAQTGQYTMVFDNSAEGSWTLEMQLKQYRIEDLAREHKLLLIGGAEINSEFPCLTNEHFLPRILDYNENILAQEQTDQIFSKQQKPWTFLFLNGRTRPHRKYLLEKLKRSGALARGLYTMLDARPSVTQWFSLRENGTDVMSLPNELKLLPTEYEVDRYRNPVFDSIDPERANLKPALFSQEWGEIYLEPAPYIDTYFSLVTETVCAESNHSFRTEKIAKPLAMGHPFIVAANTGFYRDLQNMGFQTFGHVIDETFDRIDNAQDRMNRIVDIVTDLCQQDLASFLKECYTVCKYNQQRLAEYRTQVRQEFPDRFFHFIQQHRNE